MRIILFLSLFFISLFSISHPITRDAAQKLAERQMKRIHKRPIEIVEVKSKPSGRRVKYANDSNAPAYYLFNAADGQGFVIVAGDDAFPSIIGYSDRRAITSEDEMPDALVMYMDIYHQYVEAVRSGEAESPNLSQRRADGISTGEPIVSPLLTTQWGQDAPYNLLTPQVGKKQAAVGCVATALAQLMRYWKWPKQGTGYMAYSTEYGTLSSDFSSHVYAWDDMTDKVTNTSSDAAKSAVSQLCYDCGVAVKMDYGKSSSSNTDAIIYALYKYFGYKASTLHYYYRDCMASEQEWLSIIKNELQASRPIQMRASSDSEGHSFILDGYDSNDYVHVNWGWNGKYNGYYDYNLLNPGSDKFNKDAAILVGIEPDTLGTDKRRQQVSPYLVSAPRISWKQRKVTQSFSVSIDTLYNIRSDGHNFRLGIGLYDSKGTFIADISKESTSKTVYYAGGSGTYNFGSISCQLTDEVIAQCSESDYVLRVLSKEVGYDEWMWPDIVGGPERNKIPVYIHDGVMEFNTYSLAIEQITADSVSSHAVYNLYGQPQRSLQRGINIVNGKKLYVR